MVEFHYLNVFKRQQKIERGIKYYGTYWMIYVQVSVIRNLENER
jgi:hypothetical protein